MVDYASMSDEELRATIQRERAELNAQKNIPAADYASMSDDELRATIRRERAALFPPAPEEEPGLLSGTGDYILDIGRKLKSGTGQTISSLGWLAGSEGAEKYGTEMAQAAEAAMSPVGAERSKRPIFTAVDNPALQAEWEAKIRAGEVSTEAIPFQQLLNFHPSGLAKVPYAVAESVPGMVAGMGAAYALEAALPVGAIAGVGGLTLRALGPLARGVSMSPAALGSRVIGTTAITSSEALQAGAMSGQQTEKQALEYLTANPGALEKSEIGRAALQETNGDVDAAIKVTAARMGMDAFYQVGAATGVLSLPGAALQSRLTSRVANKSLLKEMGIGAVGEASQEGPQSAAEAYFGGNIMGEIDPSQKPTLGGVLSAGLEGMFIGAPMGGGMGLAAKVISLPQDPDKTLEELEAAVRAMINSRDEQVRARAQQYLADIQEARQLLLPAPPKTIGGKPFGGEDIIDVARAQPDLVRGWRQILEDPEIKTADQMRQALLRAAGQEPKPNIRGQRYDTDALASENLVPPSTTEEGAAGEYNPLGGLSDAKIVGFAETNRDTNNPTVNAILDQPTTTNIEKARLIRDFYLKEYGPNYEILLGIPETRFDDATIASSNQLSALGLMDINARNRADEEAQAAAARIAAAQEETRKTLEAASAALRPSTRKRTGEAGVEAMRQAGETSGRGNAPYTGPNDPSVLNYLRGLAPNTDVSLFAMQEAIPGLTKEEAQDAISGNTGKLGQKNTLLVMKNGKPTTQPARGPGAPASTAASPRGPATNTEDMTGTRRTDLSETAGEGVTPEPRVETPPPSGPMQRLDAFIQGLSGTVGFNLEEAHRSTATGSGKRANKSAVEERLDAIANAEGSPIVKVSKGRYRRIGVVDDVHRMIHQATAFQPLKTADIAQRTGLPLQTVDEIARRYARDPSVSETTRGLTRQSENLLTETGTPGVYERNGRKGSDAFSTPLPKTQFSIAGGTSPNLDRVLAEAAAKNGQTQPSPAAPQTEGKANNDLGSSTRLQPVYDEDGFVTSTRTVSADTPFTEDYKGLSLDLLQEKLELSLQNAATAGETIAKVGDNPMLIEALETENKKIKAIKSLMSSQTTAQPKPAAQPQQTASPEENIAPTPSLGGTFGAQALGLSEATAGQEAPQGASKASGTNAYAPTSKEALAKARKVVAEKLRQLRASGKVGAEVANRISQLLKDPNFDAEQIMRAFAVADALSKTFGGTEANLRVEFLKEIAYKHPVTEKIIQIAGEAAASQGDVRGLIKISLSKDLFGSLVRDTAFHEGFHFLQDMIHKYDPKTAEFLFGKRIGSDPNNGRGIYSGGAFRDGMTLSDIDPTIKRALQNAAPEKGGPSYWDILKGRYDSSEFLRSDFTDQREAVAYVFGALADAKNNGHQLGGLKPAFRRFLNFLTQFSQNLRNAFRGYGYTNTNEILSKFASGEKQQGYGRDIKGDFSGSTGQRQAQRAVSGDKEGAAKKTSGNRVGSLKDINKAIAKAGIPLELEHQRGSGYHSFIYDNMSVDGAYATDNVMVPYTRDYTINEWVEKARSMFPDILEEANSRRPTQGVKREEGSIVKLTPKTQRSIAGESEGVPEGTSKVGISADIKRIIDLFGPKMYSSGMANVTAKELLQNSFDGLKSAYATGRLEQGSGVIDIASDRNNRIIVISDNGAGMSPETVRDAFLTIAGTNKEGLAVGDASGGFGVAKMAFIFGNERLILNTVKDGVRTTLDTNGNELLDGNADIRVEPTDDMNGTAILIKVPETYTNSAGNQERIIFPNRPSGFDVLQKPLIGNVDIFGREDNFDMSTLSPDMLREYALSSYYNEHPKFKKQMNIGNKQPIEDTPLMTTARFPWGDIQIYYGEKKTDYPITNVLSSGLYQFSTTVPKLGEMFKSIPYDVILNVRSRVEPDSADYPFNKQREDFNKKISTDISALKRYLAKIANTRDAEDIGSNFTDIKNIRRVPYISPEDLSSMDIDAGLFDLIDPELRKSLPERKKQDVSAEFVDVKNGVVLKDGKELANASSTDDQINDENAYIDLKKFTIPERDVPSDLPAFHNNLNIDPIEEAVRREGADEVRTRYFVSRIATVFQNFARSISAIDRHSHWQKMYGAPVGVSFDKDYLGCYVMVPYRGMFVNPASAKGQGVKAIAESFIHTMMHEAAHDISMKHDEDFAKGMARLYTEIEDVDPDLVDNMREEMRQLVKEYMPEFKALRSVIYAADVENVQSDAWRLGKLGRSIDAGSSGDRAKSGSSGERNRRELGGDNEGDQGRERGKGLRRGAEEAGGIKERRAKVQRAWAGQRSANWQFPVQNAAEAMEASGMKWEDIYWNTGLHRGENDRLWRSEIPDVGAKINDTELNRFVFDPANYGRVKLPVVYDHPDLYEEYPFLKDVYLIKLPPSKDNKKISGHANLGKKEIGVAIDFLQDHLSGSKAKYPDEVRKILTHEIQHFIQDHEGFDGGSSADKVIRVSKDMASNLLGLIGNAYYNKVKDPLDDMSEKVNRHLFKDLKSQYPNLRIDLKGFISEFGLPTLWKVEGSKISQVRDLDVMNKVFKHPDFAIAQRARDLLEEGARAVEEKRELVQNTLDGLTPEKAREHYRAAYGERESRDTEERLKLVTKEQRRSTLPGSLDKTPLTVAGQYVFENPEFDVFENDEFLNDVRDQINDLSDQISGKNRSKTQRSVAGDTDAYAFKRGSIADTNTMAFKRWFKNSVVRAPDTFKMIIDPKTGQRIREAIMVPLKVYHGGSFMRGRDIPMMGRKDGPDFPYDFMHFGTKASALARTSAFNEAEAEAKGLDITPAYLSIQKPKYVKDQGTTAKWAKVVEQAKAEGYDGLIYTNEYEDVGSTSYVIFDPGQAKSTDNVGTFNFADPRMERAFVGKRPTPPKKSIVDLERNLQQIRDAGGRKGFINTGKRAAAISNWITTKFDPKGTLPKKDVYRILKNLLMGNIKAIEVNANARRMIIEKGTKEQRQQIFDYFKTKYAVLPNTMPADLRDAAIQAKAEIAYIGRQLVAKGILTKEQVDANEGEYLPRLYMQYLKEAKGFGTGSLRGSNRDYAMQKEDIPEDIRKAMGEILEPGLPYMKAAVVPVRDMAIIDFLSDIASFEDAEWVAKGDLVDWRGTKVSPFWLSEQMRDVRDNMLYFQDDPATLATMKKVADEMQAIIDKTDMRENVGKDFKRLPNTSRYGALRGMAVRKEIYQDIAGMGTWSGDLDFFSKLFSSGGLVPKAVNTWKLSKTVFSPTTHCRQLFSNMIVADISGISMHDIPVRMVQAIDDMINDTGGWKIAKDNGVTATGVVDAEMRSALKDLKKMANAATGGVFSVVDLNKWSDHWITKLSPSNLYQGSDYLFKTMKIIDEMKRYEKKLGPPKNAEDRRLREGAAVLEANEWFMDYSDVHDWVKTARQTWLPFVTYQYKILPKIAETMLKNPQRFAPYVALFYALPALAAAMMDLDEEDVERLKNATKSYVRKNPHALPLPWQDASGDFQFLDVGYLFPWSFMSGLVVSAYNAATGEGPFSEFVKATTIFGSPVLTVATAFSNIDTFTGKEIINKYDTPMDQAKDVLGYIWGLAMPPILTNYGAIGGPVADWFSGDRSDIDRKGNPKRDTSQLFAQAFGFNIYPVNPAQQFAQNVMMMQNDINRAKADLSSVIRDLSMSTQRRRETIDKRTADIQRRIREMQKYINEARPTERLLRK